MPKKTRRTPSKRCSGGALSDLPLAITLADGEQINGTISASTLGTKNVEQQLSVDDSTGDSPRDSSPKEEAIPTSTESVVALNTSSDSLIESSTDLCTSTVVDNQMSLTNVAGANPDDDGFTQDTAYNKKDEIVEVLKNDSTPITEPEETRAFLSPKHSQTCLSIADEPVQSSVSTTSLSEVPLLKAAEGDCTADNSAPATVSTANTIIKPSIEFSPETDCFEEPQLESVQLRQQLEQMSARLLNAQNQIDHLLEEKRSWLQHSAAGFMSSTQVTAAPNVGQGGAGELRGRWLQAKNQAETYKREKEAMVIKYAQSEQKRLAAETRLQELERKMAKSTNGTVPSTPTKGSPSAGKTHTDSEHRTAPDAEFQTRWIQAEKALNTAREQVESLRRGQATAETRLSTLESRLSQAQEALKAEQRKTSSQADTINRLNRSLESAMKQAKDAERLREREAERLCAEVAYQETQERMKRVLAENEDLKDRANQLDPLRIRLTEAEKRIAELTAENNDLMDLHAEIEAGKHREDQLSEFTRRLTEHNANLQSEHLVALSRLDELTQKLAEQEQLVSRSTTESATTTSELLARFDQCQSQIADLQAQIEQLRQSESDLIARLATEREQAQLTHRRDTARIRDLIRQLARTAHSRVAGRSDPNDSAGLAATASTVAGGGGGLSPPQSVTDDISSPDADTISKLSFGSRTSSVHSLDSATPINLTTKPVILGNPLMITGGRNGHSPPRDQHSCSLAGESAEPDQVAVLNKLDRLQRTQVRLTDKIEFLQEHCCELNEQLNKKSRIIQNLLILIDKQSGSVSPNSLDTNKERIARTGGLMASLYTGWSNSSAPDRDTYLEISQKLQRVVEDTLFKNITLKDNLSTLGLEISSLNSLISEIRARLCPTCKSATDQIQPVRKTSFNPVHSAQPLRLNPEPPTFKEGGVNA